MTDLSALGLADPAPDAPGDIDLRAASALVAEQAALVAEKADLEARLKDVNVRLSLNREKDLPAALMRIGWGPGTKAPIGALLVEFARKYQCGQLDDLPDSGRRRPDDDAPKRSLEERAAALDWLEANGHGDLAKETIQVQVGRGQEALVRQILDFLGTLRSNSMTFARARVVPWNTLSRFAREQDEALEEPPLDLLGVRQVNVAQVKERKENS